MPFQLMGRLGPRDDVLDVGPDSPLGSGKFWGNGVAQCYVLGECGIGCAKATEPVKLLFGIMSGWAQGIMY